MFVPNITGQVIGLHSTGQIRILCVNAPNRHLGLTTLPTSAEAGLPGMITLNFFGIFAPTGTPKPIMDRVNEATQAALADKEFQRRLASAAFDPMPGLGPEKAKAYVAEEFVRWRKVVERADIKVQQ
jgi:tripartite-type tricarboxylate transporter receptor subunit TctC